METIKREGFAYGKPLSLYCKNTQSRVNNQNRQSGRQLNKNSCSLLPLAKYLQIKNLRKNPEVV
mgnify:CR=1 FL=1